MKLEIKHIAGYLPYGLEGQFKLSQVAGVELKNDEIRHKLMTADNCQFFLNYCKPILRPLSDLTKEIEHNGEKFVPIVKIGKMLGFLNLEPFELDDSETEYGWTDRGMDDSQPYSFGYFENGNFGVWPDYISKDDYPMYVQTNIQVIELLYELHFDIHGLIEQGLAIDKNTLK